MSALPTFASAIPRPAVSVSDTSDSSYTSEELRMGRGFWMNSPERNTPSLSADDGMWEYSPVVQDQMELLRDGRLGEGQVEEAIGMLLALMRVEEEVNEPQECPLDIAAAIQDDRLNPWGFGEEWSEEKSLTSRERIVKWQGGSPEFQHVELPLDEEEEEECTCGADGRSVMSDFDFEDCVVCMGPLCALVRDDASEEEVEKANARLAKTTKYELLRFTTEEACRREAEREPVEEVEEEEEEVVEEYVVEEYVEEVRDGYVEYDDEEEEEEEAEEYDGGAYIDEVGEGGVENEIEEELEEVVEGGNGEVEVVEEDALVVWVVRGDRLVPSKLTRRDGLLNWINEG